MVSDAQYESALRQIEESMEIIKEAKRTIEEYERHEYVTRDIEHERLEGMR